MLLTSFHISPVRIRHTLHSIIFWDDTERTVVITEQRDEVPFRLTQIYPVTLPAFLLHTCCLFLGDHFQMGCCFTLMAITPENPFACKSGKHPSWMFPFSCCPVTSLPTSKASNKSEVPFSISGNKIRCVFFSEKKGSHWSQVGNILVLCFSSVYLVK